MFALTLSFPLFSPRGNLWPRWVSNLTGGILALFSWLSQNSPMATREDDRRLIEEALSGDPGFEKLVRTYERLVYRVAFRFLSDETEASDVAQEVFLRIHRSLAKFRGDSALSTWIYAITANLSRNAIRSRKNRAKVQVLAPEEKDGDRPFWDRVVDNKSVSSSRGLESRELSVAIQKALAEVPIDYREAVVLRDMEGLDYQDIARTLETQVGTVKSRIARGRALLREKLEEWL